MIALLSIDKLNTLGRIITSIKDFDSIKKQNKTFSEVRKVILGTSLKLFLISLPQKSPDQAVSTERTNKEQGMDEGDKNRKVHLCSDLALKDGCSQGMILSPGAQKLIWKL